MNVSMYSIAVDLVILIMVIAFVAAGYKKGFVMSVYRLISGILCVAIAYAGAIILTPIFFTSIVKTGTSATVEEIFANENVISELSEFVGGISGVFANFPSEASLDFGVLVDIGLESAVEILHDTVIEPLVSPVIFSGLLIGIFFILSIISHIIGSILQNVRKIPIIGKFDGLLGGVVGIVNASVGTLILAVIIHLILLVYNDPLFNEDTMNKTMIFKYAYTLPITGQEASHHTIPEDYRQAVNQFASAERFS